MDQNAYDFLNNDGSADGGKKKRIIVAAGGLLFLIIIGILFYALMFGGKKDTSQIILPVAGVQADIIAITSAGAKDARDGALINHTSTVSLVVTSHSNALNGFLGKDAAKSAKAYQNTDYTKKLEDAASNGTFDQTYESILSQRLDLYRQKLVAAYGEIQDVKLKQQLAKMHDEAKVLSGEPTTP